MAAKGKAVEPADEVVPGSIEALKALTSGAQGIDFLPDSWDQVAEAFAGEIIEIEGSPYTVVDKATLVDKPFLIVDVKFYHSKQYDSEAVAICALTREADGSTERVVFNDGSTGVFQQILNTVSATKRKAGIVCEHGLKASTYDVEVVDGMNDTVKTIEATTYYFA